MGANLDITEKLQNYINDFGLKLNPVQEEIINYNKSLGDIKRMQVDPNQCHFLHLMIKVSNIKDVLEIGTGFMMIKRNVFDDFKEAFPQFTYRPDHNRSEHFAGDRMIHAYFDTVIDSKAYLGDISGDSERYLSEDYRFCRLWQKLGGEIWLDPKTKLNHIGTYTFEGNVDNIISVHGP